MREEWVDIGEGVSIQFRYLPDETKPGGIAYRHPNGKGGFCEGWVPFNETLGSEHGWDVVCEKPLTLSPSLLCRACGHHGHIRNGVWTPC